MQLPIVSYPIPNYQNLPIHANYYQPNIFVISNITLGTTTIVTTSTNMNFIIGQLVRLLIPAPYGSTQLNEVTGYVISIPMSNQVELTINSSRNVNPFISGTSTPYPQIVPVGDVNQGYQSITGLNIPFVGIPGSFINIS